MAFFLLRRKRQPFCSGLVAKRGAWVPPLIQSSDSGLSFPFKEQKSVGVRCLTSLSPARTSSSLTSSPSAQQVLGGDRVRGKDKGVEMPTHSRAVGLPGLRSPWGGVAGEVAPRQTAARCRPGGQSRCLGVSAADVL